MAQTLAIKYRPKTFEDVTEQGSIKIILQQQLITNTHKNCYLFCGGAGTGKTTCARIFANEINKGEGNPIELDAASHNGVDDVRQIIEQAQNKSLNSEYKVFIVDECHSISNAGWQAFLKLIEEPPVKSIFIFCTTDPQKIPKTILSRVQRYDFQRISHAGIVNRLWWILESEGYNDGSDVVDREPVEYIAKIADGGMRDAISLLDKCLAYSTDLTMDNVLQALGIEPYSVYITLTNALIEHDKNTIIKTVEEVHSSGKDLKQFIRQYLDFVLNACKFFICEDWSLINLPETVEIKDFLTSYRDSKDVSVFFDIMDVMLKIDNQIKFNANPKMYIEAKLLTWEVDE